MPVRAGIGAFFSPLSKNCFSLDDFLLRLIWTIKNPANLSGEQGLESLFYFLLPAYLRVNIKFEHITRTLVLSIKT